MKNDADLTTGQFQRFRINAKIIPLAPVNADERNEGKKKVRHAHIDPWLLLHSTLAPWMQLPITVAVLLLSQIVASHSYKMHTHITKEWGPIRGYARRQLLVYTIAHTGS